MARGVQRLDLYSLANIKGLPVLWRSRDCFTILAADDWFAAELLELSEQSVPNSNQSPSGTVVPSSYFLRHDPSGCKYIRDNLISRLIRYTGSLMCVDNRRKIDLPRVDLFLQYRRNSNTPLNLVVVFS